MTMQFYFDITECFDEILVIFSNKNKQKISSVNTFG